MKWTDVKVGQVLRLKPDRQAAYNIRMTTIRVDALQERPGYTKSFVVHTIRLSGNDMPCTYWYFKPSNFKGLA